MEHYIGLKINLIKLEVTIKVLSKNKRLQNLIFGMQPIFLIHTLKKWVMKVEEQSSDV